MIKLLQKWKQYRYRFVPWLAINFKDRSIRSVTEHDTDIVITHKEFSHFLHQFLRSLHEKHEGSKNAKADTEESFQNGQQVLYETCGFCVERRPSVLESAGTGVKVTHGTVPAASVTSLYCGLVYEPYEPIFFQSIGNPFIFRCADGTLLDGNDRGISRSLYKSCRGRDSCWPLPSCDETWLSPRPQCPLNVGQYVNNHTKEYPPNVAYQEFSVPVDFPVHLRQYLPNNHYTSIANVPDGVERMLRIVALVSLREIQSGEELFSSYFTIVR
ncbi:SET domain-containing protein 9 [Aplysia californica]|uniref:SET domain-containing protein 9 n=1 Tax=Aplysia californica TaxID=6500 RepID=A0ABM0JPA7_APLCA|nr:SET domain-containing protein 9 [Aplysia californica]